MMVHIYSLDNLASHAIPNLLKKKYLNKLILRYMDSKFPCVESSSMKLLTYLVRQKKYLDWLPNRRIVGPQAAYPPTMYVRYVWFPK